MIKKIFNLFLIFIILISFTTFSFAQISSDDKIQVNDQLKVIVETLNRDFTPFGDERTLSPILDIVSPTSRENLNSEILSNLNTVNYFNQTVRSYKYLDDGKIEVRGNFEASGASWNVSGFRNYFIFEKVDGTWMLYDTDFHLKMGVRYVFRSVFKIFLILAPFYLIAFAFWIWMLIDAVKRDFPDKTLWVLLIIFLTFLGAILYFFIKRKKLKKEEKLKQKA